MSEQLRAEILVVFQSPLGATLVDDIARHFAAPSADVATCARGTHLEKLQGSLDKAVYASDKDMYRQIYIPEDAQTLAIYIERMEDLIPEAYQAQIAQVERRTRESIESIRRFGKSTRNKIKSVNAVIQVGSTTFSEATQTEMSERVRALGVPNVASKLSVPLSTALISFYLSHEGLQAAKMLLVALCSVIVATILEVLLTPNFKFVRK